MDRTKTTGQMNTPQLATATLRIRPRYGRGGSLLLDLPIAARLTLGFLTAALVASLITGIIGVQRSQSLNRQSDFYQNLLQTNTSLTTGANFLQLMNTEAQQLITVATGPTPSTETMMVTINASRGLESRYNTIINQYIAGSLIAQHPDQVALLAEANHSVQITQQRTLAGSALRTWRVYQVAQNQVVDDVQAGNIEAAQNLLRVQAEPTNADAQSALRALISFDERLASFVQDAASIEEQNQIISTIIGAVIAFILIAVIGWFISNTLVQRLRQLRQVTQAVEQGQLNARVGVVGRDEIADVSASFNAMLEAIVGLLAETRLQRDALTNAAEHLFSDMRVVSAGDLRINASVSNDPIGMLANAFNFTVGRFRRFVLRTQGALEQLDVIARQEIERSEALLKSPGTQGAARSTSKPLNPRTEEPPAETNNNTVAQIQRIRGRMQRLARDGISGHTHAALALVEQSALIVQTINNMLTTNIGSSPLASSFLTELHGLENLVQRMTTELQSLQRGATRGFLDIDADLTKLSASSRKEKIAPKPALDKRDTGEQVRRELVFVNEISTMAHQLASLAQEMRVMVVSFQLDVPNSGIPLASKEESISHRLGGRYNEEKKQTSADLRARQRSSLKLPSLEQ